MAHLDLVYTVEPSDVVSEAHVLESVYPQELEEGLLTELRALKFAPNEAYRATTFSAGFGPKTNEPATVTHRGHDVIFTDSFLARTA